MDEKLKKGKPKINEKAASFVAELLTTRGFKKRVNLIRKKLSIRSQSIDITEFDQLVIRDKSPRIPATIKNRKLYLSEINELLKTYGLSSEWFSFFSDYVLFGFIGELLRMNMTRS
ncbi:MAG: hypothetical protein AAB417_01610 [Patescibacteria group bacterium]